MESIFDSMFDSKLFSQDYRNNEEYMSDMIKQAELVIFYYLKFFGPKDEEKEYFNINIAEHNQEIPGDVDEQKLFIRNELSRATFYIQSRVKQPKKDGGFFAFEYIKEIYKLTEFETFFLVLIMLPKIDSKYEKVFRTLQDDPQKSYPDYDLGLKLYFFVDDISQIDDVYKIKSTLIGKFSALILNPSTNEIDSRILSFIQSNGSSKIELRGVQCIVGLDDAPLQIMDDIPKRMADISYNNVEGKSIFFYLNGRDGIGKKTITKRFARILGTAVIMIDVMQMDTKDANAFYEFLMSVCREAVINQGILCFYNFDCLMDEENENEQYINLIMSTAQQFSAVIVLLSNTKVKNRALFNNYMWLDVPLRYPNKEESIKLWDLSLSKVNIDDKIEPFEMANKFTFTPGQISGTVIEADKLKMWKQSQSISKREFYDCAYTQIVHDLDKKATLIYAKYNWDQLILAKDQKDMLKNACDQVKYKHIVYDKWGFEKRLAYGRGVSMLFAGPPGTGKTMAAQVVANELDIEIYKVDLSQIVSKYIGETEKNLNDLFNEAKKSNVILFFDETDAILGKRTEVKDSHDKNANLETSYLLQKMEEYDGITVMSTNYLENIDAAFFRRISYVIHFPFPDIASRKMIWQNMYPKEMPISEDIDFDYLAEQFEIAGGNIKNIAVTSAFLAARENSILEMRHIIKAIKYELTKQGKTLLREDFGEHGYLLDI